ncbi:MAG: 5-formyltetrahydrofolate cyclo-ligase [Desulfonauticus sp.]|nr:5-formyltetrahydrofolate cyclo-ligase [Desulfonauticus sp.]
MQGGKKKLRTLLLQRRLSLTLKEVAAKSKIIQQKIKDNISLQAQDKIFIYFPIKNEVDTLELIRFFWSQNIQVFLPNCSILEQKMLFFKVKNFSQLKTGKYNIPEPDPKSCPSFQGTPPKIIFMPAVGFDKRLYRLGYGGGYYDRLLADPIFSNIQTIGLAYEFQIIARLPIDRWDIPLHKIFTEKNIYTR